MEWSFLRRARPWMLAGLAMGLTVERAPGDLRGDAPSVQVAMVDGARARLTQARPIPLPDGGADTAAAEQAEMRRFADLAAPRPSSLKVTTPIDVAPMVDFAPATSVSLPVKVAATPPKSEILPEQPTVASVAGPSTVKIAGVSSGASVGPAVNSGTAKSTSGADGTRSVPTTMADGTRSVPATLGDGTRSVPATLDPQKSAVALPSIERAIRDPGQGPAVGQPVAPRSVAKMETLPTPPASDFTQMAPKVAAESAVPVQEVPPGRRDLQAPAAHLIAAKPVVDAQPTVIAPPAPQTAVAMAPPPAVVADPAPRVATMTRPVMHDPPPQIVSAQPVPAAAPRLAMPPLAPTQSLGVQAAMARADAMNRHAYQLAERGAIYAARSEFYQVLQLLAASLDSQADRQDHEQKLAAGLRAMEEADDFAVRDARAIDDMKLDVIVEAHRTPVLKDTDCEKLTPRAAMNRYLDFATQQMAAAVQDLPPGSLALCGLGKVYALPPASHGPTDITGGAKSLAYQRAALVVDARNWRAANELGVQLVRVGQLEEAKQAFLMSLRISPEPTVWENLAMTHERMGETDLAQRAKLTAQSVGKARKGAGSGLVQWVDNDTFAQSTPVGVDPIKPAVATGNNANAKRKPRCWFRHIYVLKWQFVAG